MTKLPQTFLFSLLLGLAPLSAELRAAPAENQLNGIDLINDAFEGGNNRVERLCYNMTVDSEVFSPIYADKLLSSLVTVSKKIVTHKNAHIQLSIQIIELLREKGITSAEVESFLIVNQQLKIEIEHNLRSLPLLVSETGPKIVIGLARIKKLKERILQDSELIDKKIDELVSNSRLDHKIYERWRQIDAQMQLDARHMAHIIENWLFCHQNILPDLKKEFQPLSSKRRYRHLVLIPMSKTLAGSVDLITTISDVYARIVTEDSMSKANWWKHMPSIQQMVVLGKRDQLVKKWEVLLHDIRRSDRPVLINHLIDWALAGDSLFSNKVYAVNFLRLLALREQTRAQKQLVERLASFEKQEIRQELEIERNKLLSLYGEYIAHFMKIAQEMAPIINKLNELATIKELLYKETEKIITK